MLKALSALLACSLLCATAAQAAAADIIVRSDGADIHSGPWFMRVTAIADDILRVRATAAGDLPEDASWAVPAEMRGRSVHVTVKQNADGVDLKTATLAVRIERSPLRLVVSDLAGHVISADAPTGAVNVVGAGFVAGFSAADVSAPRVLQIAALANFVVAVWIVRLLPQNFFRSLFQWYFRLFHAARVEGLENLPPAGERAILPSSGSV